MDWTLIALVGIAAVVVLVLVAVIVWALFARAVIRQHRRVTDSIAAEFGGRPTASGPTRRPDLRIVRP